MTGSICNSPITILSQLTISLRRIGNFVVQGKILDSAEKSVVHGKLLSWQFIFAFECNLAVICSAFEYLRCRKTYAVCNVCFSQWLNVICYRRNCLHWKNVTFGTLMPGRHCLMSRLCRRRHHCGYVIVILWPRCTIMSLIYQSSLSGAVCTTPPHCLTCHC